MSGKITVAIYEEGKGVGLDCYENEDREAGGEHVELTFSPESALALAAALTQAVAGMQRMSFAPNEDFKIEIREDMG